MNVTIHFFTYRLYYRHLFYKSTAIICQLTWSALLKNELLWHSSNRFVTIIRGHARWSLTGNRKQKNMSNCFFLPVSSWSTNFQGSRSFKKFKWCSLTKKKMKKNENNAWSKVTVSSNWQPRQHVPVKWIPPLEGDGNYFLTPLSYYGWQWPRRKFRHPWTWSERYRETISIIKQTNRIAAASDI